MAPRCPRACRLALAASPAVIYSTIPYTNIIDPNVFLSLHAQCERIYFNRILRHFIHLVVVAEGGDLEQGRCSTLGGMHSPQERLPGRRPRAYQHDVQQRMLP